MKRETKGIIVLILILVLVIAFGVYAYIRYNKNIEKSKAIAEEKENENVELTCYSYGGVNKTAFLNYQDAIKTYVKCYNESNGEGLASMIDFAANDVLSHKGLEKFDENLYSMVTDVVNYKDDYYNNSLVIMNSYLQTSEAAFIKQANEYKVKMELGKISELKQVENSKFLYEATAKIKINDKTAKKKYDTNTKITFISYDEGKTFYILKSEVIEDEK